MSQLYDLLDVMCERALSADEAARIETLVRGNPQAMRLYFSYLQLDAALRFEHGAGATTLGMAQAQGQVKDHGKQTYTPTLSPFRGRSVWYIAAAAMITLAFTAWMLINIEPQSTDQHPIRSQPVALLTGSAAAMWSDPPVQTALGSELTPGTLKLTTGTVQLMFHSGAVVTLQGPCEFDLTSEGEGFLRQGLLHAYVPQRARGFRIDAPGGVSVTDLGTEFTMRVDGGRQASVRVFEGMVMVQSAADSTSQTFTAGQAARVVAGRIQTAAADDLARLPRMLFAAGIEWDKAFDVTGPESIDLSGELVEAITPGGNMPVTVAIGDASVTFEPGHVWRGGAYNGALPTERQTTPLGQVLTTCEIGHGPVQPVELTDLIVGQRYQIQVFYADERGDVTMKIADAQETLSEASEVVLHSSGSGGMGQSVIGHFTATASTRRFIVEAGPDRRNAHISALVLRRIDGAMQKVNTSVERNGL
ncbi:FecR domain-containing protein [Planctomycetales bacterium ZRK34]|nr:FecR domain-containing protein [Planctomycetales bacterium ZRK34]